MSADSRTGHGPLEHTPIQKAKTDAGGKQASLENSAAPPIFVQRSKGRDPPAPRAFQGTYAMPGLSDTITNLARLGKLVSGGAKVSKEGRLKLLAAHGTNPGALLAKYHAPADLESHAALVVVLHGCTQTAADYDIGSGWSRLADQYGFAVLFPEQQRQNNPNLCFNWFSPHDSRRDSGEALSIRQMVDAMIDLYRIDPGRVFVTGLSAGGAMASVMLAAYPDVFAGGAIIAGLPFGCARSVPQALELMRGHGIPSGAKLSALVRSASSHSGPWPTISIWHGSADATVSPTNAKALVEQWRTLHRAGDRPSRLEVVDGYPRQVWCNHEGREVIEEYSITGMSHGTPLDTRSSDGCGQSGAFMLDANISSTRHICRFWGLANEKPGAAQGRRSSPPQVVSTEAASVAAESPTGPQLPQVGAGKIIEDALRAAGLMR